MDEVAAALALCIGPFAAICDHALLALFYEWQIKGRLSHLKMHPDAVAPIAGRIRAYDH